MGIYCEISLYKPAGQQVFQPGSIVSGAIKYYLHEEYEFTSIIVSLKGLGKMYLEDLSAKRRNRMYQYSNNEVYINTDAVIYSNMKQETLPVGQYETKFSFQLPYNIPASLEYKKNTSGYDVRCNIQYYIRIKFARTGCFKYNFHFKKEINVISGQTPRMTTEPLVYGDHKKLIQLSSLFSSKKGIVKLKATIATSVLRPGERVQIDYEVENDTNVAIKDIRINLLEVDKFTSTGGSKFKIHSEVAGAEFSHGPIPGGKTVNFTAEVTVPELCCSLEHSKIMARDYSMRTMVVLPMPHINMPLEIPFQVINRLSSSFEESNAAAVTEHAGDAPPSYWEAMGEDKKESFTDNGEEAQAEKK